MPLQVTLLRLATVEAAEITILGRAALTDIIAVLTSSLGIPKWWVTLAVLLMN